MTEKDTTVAGPEPPQPKRIPRSCSDVYRLWAAIGLGILFSLLFQLGRSLFEELGLRRALTPAQQAIEEDFGSNLVAWVGFAISYLWLGIRAFRGADHGELVRRILGSPLPRSVWKRWLLAGGGGIVWPVIISIWAFSTIITFSFALYYARKDVEGGGLEFPGPEESVFSDYVYLAAGCSVTFGTTDTTVTTASMRRFVTFQSVLAWVLNTMVIATFISLVLN